MAMAVFCYAHNNDFEQAGQTVEQGQLTAEMVVQASVLVHTLILRFIQEAKRS